MRPGEDEPWRSARTEDLVQILDDLGARQDRLEAESARLGALQRDLEAGSTVDAVAEAQRQLEALQVLTGTTPVVGPGLTITITDPEGVVDAPLLLDAVQELRDAGAEAIQVGSTPGRRRHLVRGRRTGTWWSTASPSPAPSGSSAIGDPETMTAAVSIPGGLADSVRTRGADFAASTSQALSISVTVPETTD